MPLYEYECCKCESRFERIQSFGSEPVKECPSCGGQVRRLLGVPALQFKGTGWYVTDYGKGNDGRPEAQKNGKEGVAEKKTETATAEKTKTEKKTAEKKAATA
jgi:putative FmdB family regulatory protein